MNAAGKAIKVLVVEDSDDDARLAMRMLRRGGFNPGYQRVQDLAALRAALSGERWDAVLSDFRLPGFNGLDVLAVFRASGLDIPFIFFSGTIGEETAVEAMRAGASDYVMKQSLARLAPVMERELAQARIRAQHRQGQIDLGLSRDQYVDLYDFAPVGYLTLSSEGLIAQVNLTGADMLGAPRDALLNTRFAQFVSPGETERWYLHFLRVLHHGERQRLELAFQGRGGQEFDAQLDCMRVGGTAAPMVRLALTDISDCKKAEADLRQFEAQLRDIQKMESLGTLAGGIAHDFNNILGAILGNVALARGEVGPGHAALVSLEEIQKASLRARNLVQQILTFSRREQQVLVNQPLRPVVEETRKLLRATFPARVELDVVLTDTPLHVQADSTQVQQVLMNLCTNAWHALADGAGRIGMGLEPLLLDEESARGLGAGLPAGSYAHLWVSDTGSGMDQVTRERIFEPFFTTKPVGQGTGLGLSVVHGIVSAHQGAITVDSQPGRGSTFHLYFPVAVPAVPVESPPVPEALPGHGEHVLYVDDDEMMVLMVERILERSGYRVSGFQDAHEAVEAVRQHPADYDFVVTDFNMPEFSGLDVAHELARIRPGLPVVISSGYITDELRTEARLAGVQSLLEKQNTFQELSSLVGRLLKSPHPGH